jgi:hypothetical protein
VLYSRALNMNINMRIPVASTLFNSSNVHIPFQLDFTQRKYFWSYFHIMDVVAAVGGVNAAFTPILKKLAPFFMLWFLFALARIIKNNYIQAYRNELTSVVQYALDQLKLMSEESSNIAYKAQVKQMHQFLSIFAGKLNDPENPYNI